MYSKYSQELHDKIIQLAEKGFTNKDICKRLKISQGIFYQWLDKNSKYYKLELLESLKKAKDVVDETVEASLYKRAMGYKYNQTIKIVDKKTGKLINYKRIVKEQPGDTTAQIFWLKNRQPQKWRDKTYFEQEGDVNHRIKLPKEIEEKLIESLNKYEKK